MSPLFPHQLPPLPPSPKASQLASTTAARSCYMEAAQWKILMTSVSISLHMVVNQTVSGPQEPPQRLSCGLSPAAGLAGIHVVTQLLQFVILGQLSVVADLLEVAHALRLRKDV